MTLPVGTALPAYGMAINPFKMRTLDPLCSKTDRDSVSLVDGWKDLAEVEDLITRRVVADKPVFFFICGASSTGRSSVANYLVHLWSKARGVSSEAILVHRRDPGPDGGVYTSETQIREWAQKLLLRDDPLSLTLTTQQRLEELTDSDTIFKFAQSLRSVDQDLRQPGNGNDPRYLAAIMERGKGDDLVQKVKDCFEPTRAIVIVTVDRSRDTANLLSNVSQVLSPDEGLRIDIGPIYGDDVVTLIQDRWAAVCQNVENPFDLTATAGVFDTPRPIARVVGLLEGMLTARQVLHDEPDPWPISRSLALGKEQMRGLLQLLDRQLPAGWEA
jgi:hypothetical protein